MFPSGVRKTERDSDSSRSSKTSYSSFAGNSRSRWRPEAREQSYRDHVLTDREKEKERLRHEEREKKRRRKEEEDEDYVHRKKRHFGAYGVDSEDDESDIEGPVVLASSSDSDDSPSKSDSRLSAPVRKVPALKYEFIKDDVDGHAMPQVFADVEGQYFVPVDCSEIVLQNEHENRKKRLKRRLTSQVHRRDLDTQRVESQFEELSFDQLRRSGNLIAYPEMPINITKNVFIPRFEQPIDLSSMTREEFDNFRYRTVFSQISATDRDTFYKTTLSRNPDDCEMWICRIKLQDELFPDARAANLERKLAMVKEAKKHCAANIDIWLCEVQLMVEKFGSASDEVKNHWEKLTMTIFPNNIKAWRERIVAFRNDSNVFKFNEYEKLIQKCLKRLSAILNGSFRSHPPQQGTAEFMIELVLSATGVAIECGFVHRVIGILQAYIEFYLFSPPNLGTHEKRLQMFANVFNSNLLKVGDKSETTHWDQVTTNHTYTFFDSDNNETISFEDEKHELQNLLQDYEPEVQDETKSYCQRWAACEVLTTKVFWKPTINKFTSFADYVFPQVHNAFADIEPYLINFVDNAQFQAEQIIFGIIHQLGFEIPGIPVTDIASLCAHFGVGNLVPRIQHWNGMDVFMQNIFKSLSTKTISLRCHVAIVLSVVSTCKQRLEDEEMTFVQAQKSLIDTLKQFMVGSSKTLQYCVMSYIIEGLHELAQVDGKDHAAELKLIMVGMARSVPCGIVFGTTTDRSEVHSALRLVRSICRLLPSFVPGTQTKFTKLSYLKQVGSYGRFDENEEVTRELSEGAFTLWKAKFANLSHNDWTPPPDSPWLGTIGEFVIELAATMHVEMEPDAGVKLISYRSYFSRDVLDNIEDLAVVFIKGSFKLAAADFCPRHEYGKIVDQLLGFVNRYPRNVFFFHRYIQELNDIDVVHFIMQNDNIEDNYTKVLRSVYGVSKAIGEWFSHGSFESLLDSVMENARLCNYTMIPDSYLLRHMMMLCADSRNEEAFLECRSVCPWSKGLVLQAADNDRRVDSRWETYPTVARDSGHFLFYSSLDFKTMLSGFKSE